MRYRNLKRVSWVMIVLMLVGSVPSAWGRGGMGGRGGGGGVSRRRRRRHVPRWRRHVPAFRFDGAIPFIQPAQRVASVGTHVASVRGSASEYSPRYGSTSVGRQSTGVREYAATFDGCSSRGCCRPDAGYAPGDSPRLDAGHASVHRTGADAGHAAGHTSRDDAGHCGLDRASVDRPGVGTRPGAGQLPAGRPGVGAGIGAGIAAGAGGANLLPGLGNRPGVDGGARGQVGDRMANRPQTREGRQEALQDRLGSRQDLRDNWQDNRGDIREDWQNWAGGNFDRHDDWHHGCWHGNAGDWWHHMWDDHTALMAFGTTMWGINRAAYAMGYWGYTNPYYTEAYPVGGDVMLDYSEPVMYESAPMDTGVAVASDQTTEAPAAAASTEAAPQPGIAEFDQARQAFYDGNYDKAMELTNQSLVSFPKDPIVHEFRALVLFAQGKYQEAAATLNSVLATGPGWDWTTLSSLYPSVDVYTKQLRALEDYQKKNADAGYAHFVLAYHYLTAGHNDAAARQLKEVLQAVPQDQVAKELLALVAGPEDQPAATSAPAQESPAGATPQIAQSDLVGQWSAQGAKDTKFQLVLDDKGNFSWTFTEGDKPQTVKGVYAVDGNVLALDLDTGGQMVAQVTPPEQGQFKFQVLGAPAGDPGLTFAKPTS